MTMMEKSCDDSAVGKTPLEQLIDLEKDIGDVKDKLSELEKVVSGQSQSDGERRTLVGSSGESGSEFIPNNPLLTTKVGEDQSDSNLINSLHAHKEPSEMSLSRTQTNSSSWSSSGQSARVSNSLEERGDDGVSQSTASNTHLPTLVNKDMTSEETQQPVVSSGASDVLHGMSSESVQQSSLNELNGDEMPMLKCGRGMLTIDQVVAATDSNIMADNTTEQTQGKWDKGSEVKQGRQFQNKMKEEMPAASVPSVLSLHDSNIVHQQFSPMSIVTMPPQLPLPSLTTSGPVGHHFVSGHTVVPYTHPQTIPLLPTPQGVLFPTRVAPISSTWRAPSSPVGLGRGISKGSVSEKPRSIGLGRGLSRGRRRGTLPKPTGYHDSSEGEWHIVSHNRKSNYFVDDIPPMGSGAGLDII